MQAGKIRWGHGLRAAAIALLLGLSGAPAMAQLTEIDPNSAIDSDLGPPPASDSGSTYPGETDVIVAPEAPPVADAPATDMGSSADTSPPIVTATGAETYQEDDLIGAAEGVFGKGAEGLGRLIQDILKKQGQPNGYIVGREGGGALVVGLRYGSGTLFHKVEGQRPVYWTGPSIGFDAGANAGSTFMLVYNLYDSQELYERFVAGEGAAYFVGGFNASYMRRGNVVLIPIRLGVGLRLGANVGYMKFSEKQDWLPF